MTWVGKWPNPGRSVSIINGKREYAEADRADDADDAGGGIGRRNVLGGVLGGLAALHVLSVLGSAPPALAAATSRPGTLPEAADDLLRGEERRYHAPLLTPGTRLVLPAGIRAVPVLDYYRRPRVASTVSEWPYLRAADGTTVDASVVPERGAPTRVAILSGFTEGWYELIHASGRADRVTWNAGQLPVLWLHGEFGATKESPYHDRFYTVALQPLSRNPYPRSTAIL
jgi:hypothetical protein